MALQGHDINDELQLHSANGTLQLHVSNDATNDALQPHVANVDGGLTLAQAPVPKAEKSKVLNGAAAERYKLPMVVNSLPSDQSTDSVPGKRRPNLVTGLHGVKVLYGRFQSSIDFDGQRHTLGTWDDPMEAAKGYAAAAYMIVHLGVRAVSAILTDEEQACLKRMSHDDFITILKFPGAWKQWQRWEELMPRWRAHYDNLARKHGEMDTVRIGRKKRKTKALLESAPHVGKFTAAAAMNGLQTPMFALDPGMHVGGVVEQGGEGRRLVLGVSEG
ncbi:hypothetical protein CLOP_g16682 [Closterium sp. NIES-67]|nr:hypothetical protein CLOP_g22051 [Closterium sp. NIES-67]GJP86686.1 hypothetical protein CLOP_g16682 [Closterium sp. NIES-67]